MLFLFLFFQFFHHLALAIAMHPGAALVYTLVCVFSFFQNIVEIVQVLIKCLPNKNND